MHSQWPLLRLSASYSHLLSDSLSQSPSESCRYKAFAYGSLAISVCKKPQRPKLESRVSGWISTGSGTSSSSCSSQPPHFRISGHCKIVLNIQIYASIPQTIFYTFFTIFFFHYFFSKLHYRTRQIIS